MTQPTNHVQARKSSAFRLLILISIISFAAGFLGGLAISESSKSCQLKIGGQMFSIK